MAEQLPSEEMPTNFELDGVEAYQLTGGWLQVSGPGGDAVLLSPVVAPALRDWLNKVPPCPSK